MLDNSLIPLIEDDTYLTLTRGLCIDSDQSDEYYDRLLKYLLGYYVHLGRNYSIDIKDLKSNTSKNYNTNFDNSYLKLDYILHDGLWFLIGEEGEYPVFNLEYYRE